MNAISACPSPPFSSSSSSSSCSTTPQWLKRSLRERTEACVGVGGGCGSLSLSQLPPLEQLHDGSDPSTLPGTCCMQSINLKCGILIRTFSVGEYESLSRLVFVMWHRCTRVQETWSICREIWQSCSFHSKRYLRALFHFVSSSIMICYSCVILYLSTSASVGTLLMVVKDWRYLLIWCLLVQSFLV